MPRGEVSPGRRPRAWAPDWCRSPDPPAFLAPALGAGLVDELRRLQALPRGTDAQSLSASLSGLECALRCPSSPPAPSPRRTAFKPLFDDATFTIRRGEKVALLGPNGTGKSTLLRVLAGLEPLDTGSIERRRDASILYLPQEPELDPALTPREIAREGLGSGTPRRCDTTSSRRASSEGETTTALWRSRHRSPRTSSVSVAGRATTRSTRSCFTSASTTSSARSAR